ncbi:hypothetical protein acdb102_42200 [Acidothermaceae bacterium B102]|nr:hypothetical protein acdb102_42200 [Acidothermaceae bacterium B102]
MVTRRQLLPPKPSVRPRLVFFGPHHEGTPPAEVAAALVATADALVAVLAPAAADVAAAPAEVATAAAVVVAALDGAAALVDPEELEQADRNMAAAPAPARSLTG